MEFTGRTGYALIVHAGIAEVVRYRRDPGGEFTIMDGRVSPFNVFTDFDANIQGYIGGSSRGISHVVHVVAVAPTAADLPARETVVLPSFDKLMAAAPGLLAKIDQAKISRGLKDHLREIMSGNHIVAACYAKYSVLGNAVLALEGVVRSAVGEEAEIFGKMGSRVEEAIQNIATAPNPNADESFQDRVRAAALLYGRGGHGLIPAVQSSEPADIDQEALARECKRELDELLVATREKISQIDRRLIDAGVHVAWRDAMNEVFEAAMQTSRTLDYGDQTVVQRGPGRR